MRLAYSLVLLATIACGPDEVVCGEYSVEVNGTCEQAPHPEPSLEQAVTQMGDCDDLAAGDGRLDLELRCADAVCAGGSFADAEEALGPAQCESLYRGWLICTFANGASVQMQDADEDLQPDGLDIGSITLPAAFDGTTASGLGNGVNLRCFVDELGAPTSGSIAPFADDWFVFFAVWRGTGLSVEDREGRPDRVIEKMTLSPRRDQ